MACWASYLKWCGGNSNHIFFISEKKEVHALKVRTSLIRRKEPGQLHGCNVCTYPSIWFHALLATFKFLIILEQGALHFHFTLIPKIYIIVLGRSVCVHTCVSMCTHVHICVNMCSALGVRLMSKESRRNGPISNLEVNSNEKNSQLSLFGVVMFDKVAANSEFVKTEPLLLREIESEVPVSLWSHFHQLINNKLLAYEFLFKDTI